MANVLVISPHPDDESIGCGGTLRKHILDGDNVEVVFLTSGEKGGHGRTMDETRIVREQEAREAAAILEITKLEFWREPDGDLVESSEVVDRIVAKIVECDADIIYVPNRHELHPDHQAAAIIAKQARSKLASQSVSPSFRMFEVWTPLQKVDHIIDITEHVEVKRRAIAAYASQCVEVAFDDAIIGLNRYRGELYSWPEGEYAEVFEEMS